VTILYYKLRFANRYIALALTDQK